MAAELDSSGNIIRREVRGDAPDDVLVEYNTSDRRYFQTDERGSVFAWSDPSGARASTLTYDEYGKPASTNPPFFQYTGQMWLNEAGVYNYKARAYAPALGRFMQTDSIGPQDDANLYAYVLNDPVNNVDPSGTLIQNPCAITATRVVCTGPAPPQPQPLTASLIIGGAGGGPNPCNPATFDPNTCPIRIIGTRKPKQKSPPNTPFIFNGRAWVFNPNYNDQCGKAVLKRSAVPLGADTLGLIPGANDAAVVTRLGSATFSGVWSAWHGDVQGIGLGYAGVSAELFGPSGAGRGVEVAKAVPVIGSLVSAYALGRDIVKTGNEFFKCNAE